LENQTKGKNISLVLKSNEESVKLVADKLRVNQVFLNMINNAINILQEGQVIVSVQRQNNDVLVKITDNGPGISPKIKDKLFTKFVTGSKSGTGLGLYICKNIIEKHGGKIWAENNQDKGATFSFTVPIKQEK
jgi:signal transduction histidine kinase